MNWKRLTTHSPIVDNDVNRRYLPQRLRLVLAPVLSITLSRSSPDLTGSGIGQIKDLSGLEILADWDCRPAEVSVS